MAQAKADGLLEGDVLLDLLVLPARMQHWTYENGVETLRALAWIPPSELMQQRNIGRLSIHQTRTVIEARLGARWESLCRLAAPPAINAPHREAWERQVRANGGVPGEPPPPEPELPVFEGDMSVDDVPLPTRMRNWVRENGVETLRALARIPPDVLMRERNLGRRSIAQTRALIEPRLGIRWGGRAPAEERQRAEEAVRLSAEYARREEELLRASFLEALRMQVTELQKRERIAVETCTGLVGPARRVTVLARRFGVTGPAVSRWLRDAMDQLRRRQAWMSSVRARVDQALEGGAVPLETLAEDPWWAAIAALPDTLDWFGRRLAGDLHVVEVEGRRYAARIRQTPLDHAWRQVRAAGSEVPLPAPPAAFHALLDPWAERLGPVLTALFRTRLDALLTMDPAVAMGNPEGVPQTPPEPRALRFGLTQAEETLAFLQASPDPVPISELEARLGHSVVTDEVLWFGRGLAGTERHFPDLDGWTRRLVPAAIEVMRRGRRGRQWLQTDLHEALRESQGLPSWLGPWHLASLLRRSGQVRWLGQRRFALLGAPGSTERIGYASELARILRARGKPLPYAELTQALERRTSIEGTALSVYLSAAPFLRCGRGVYGLLDRDLPGGPEAIAPAADALVAQLERRRRGMSLPAVSGVLSALGRPYDQWTPEMCVSALGHDPRLLRARGSGAIGLSAWESTRFPTRASILTECLDRGGGRARVSTVLKRMEATFQKPLRPYVLPVLAKACGAKVRGKWVERTAAAR